MDGTCDIDIQEEDNINIFKVDQSVHDDIRDKLEDDQQLRERIQLRDSLRKRRVELLTEVSQLESRRLELQHIKEVSNLNTYWLEWECCRWQFFLLKSKNVDSSTFKNISNQPQVQQENRQILVKAQKETEAKIKALWNIVKPFVWNFHC